MDEIEILPPAHLWRDVRIYGGTSAIMNELIGRSLGGTTDRADQPGGCDQTVSSRSRPGSLG